MKRRPRLPQMVRAQRAEQVAVIGTGLAALLTVGLLLAAALVAR